MPDGSLSKYSPSKFLRDLTAGTVVFLVALPLCLGIAVASGAPPFTGIVSGIVGGMLVGLISGSHTSVSGPAAGLTAIVAAQITSLGSFDVFLMAVTLAGLIQIIMGVARAGFVASFFPSSVIKGLLAAIGLILILKQLPYLLGHESVGENAFEEMAKESGGHEKGGHQNPIFSLVVLLSGQYHSGALAIGLMSLAILIGWDRVQWLKRSLVPSALVVVLVGVCLASLFRRFGGDWQVGPAQLVNVPVADSLQQFVGFLVHPSIGSLGQPAVYLSAITIAIVATLESMLNLEAVDNLDPQQRVSPPNRELIAQGVGNFTAGLIGGLPMTCVVVRGTVNIYAGAQSKLSAVLHGAFLLGFAVWLPRYLNMIPLSCLAAILFMTGYKLASPKLVAQLYQQGRAVFLPFMITVIAIVMTDLLIGILIGLSVSLLFILASNTKRPIHRVIEQHAGGRLHRIELANQVSFLSRAVLEKALRCVPRGDHVMLDARHTDYIDPDILSFIREFRETTAPALGIHLSFKGFREKFKLQDHLQFVDYNTSALQSRLTPDEVLQVLREGNERYRAGQPLYRDTSHQRDATTHGEYPLAVVLTCMDSRSPTHLVFDMGIGDLLSVSQAANALMGRRTLASVEMGCAVAGARLIVVLGHLGSNIMYTAVSAACDLTDTTHCGQHFQHIVEEIRPSIDADLLGRFDKLSPSERRERVDQVARRHILRSVGQLPQRSLTIRQLLEEKEIAIVGAMIDPATGRIEFMLDQAIGLSGATQAVVMA